MSGFFGIYNRNSEAIDKNIANNMLEAMLTCDPDEYNLWINGPLALGHVMTWNTPESKFEHLPLHSHSKVLVSDARIDNRDELVNKLQLPDNPISNASAALMSFADISNCLAWLVPSILQRKKAPPPLGSVSNSKYGFLKFV